MHNSVAKGIATLNFVQQKMHTYAIFNIAISVELN
jgi:hypothetical protein